MSAKFTQNSHNIANFSALQGKMVPLCNPLTSTRYIPHIKYLPAYSVSGTHPVLNIKYLPCK